VAAGRWARLHVDRGELRFQARTDPPIDVTLGEHATQAIPPGVEHEVELRKETRFHLEFLGPAASA
jgi:hypothetical protein